MASEHVDWVVMGPGDNQAQCLRCKAVVGLPTNCSIKLWVDFTRGVVREHRRCRPVAEVPRAE